MLNLEYNIHYLYNKALNLNLLILSMTQNTLCVDCVQYKDREQREREPYAPLDIGLTGWKAFASHSSYELCLLASFFLPL